MRPDELEALAEKHPKSAREFAVEAARRLGADEKHLRMAIALADSDRGAGGPIAAYLDREGLIRQSGDKDKASRLAVLACAKDGAKYCRALMELAARKGVDLSDLLPSLEPDRGLDPNSRGAREARLKRHRELVAAERAKIKKDAPKKDAPKKDAPKKDAPKKDAPKTPAKPKAEEA